MLRVLEFHFTLHACPAELPAGPVITLRSQELPTLSTTLETLYTPFDCTFEQTEAALAAHRWVFIEPDGSFVWGEGAGEQRWQIDGHLYDRAGKLIYMQLKGTCPEGVFDSLLQSVGWPERPVMMQLQPEGYVLSEAAFRRYAQSNAAH